MARLRNREGEIEKLTLQKIKDLPEDYIFASGYLAADNRVENGTELRWVACTGTGLDWCIYYHHSYHENEYIQKYGDKMFTEDVIRYLVPCDNEVWGRYRF